MALLQGPKVFQREYAPGLRSFAGLATSMRKHKVTRARKNGVAVESTGLVQNENDADTLKIFKQQPWVFA